MKKLIIPLLFSFALNFWLGANAIHDRLGRPNPAPGPVSIETSQLNVESTLPVRNANFQWSQLESTNYFIFIENLRKFGCPQDIINDIVVSDMNRIYAVKIADVRERLNPKRNYWQGRKPRPSQLDAAEVAISKERNAVVKEMIGITWEEYNQGHFPAMRDPDISLAFLSDDKKKAIQDLQNKYFSIEAKIRGDAHGLLIEEDRAELSALETQKAAEMEALLTPAERFEYGIRTSAIADRLAQDLDVVQPTETEFRTIYTEQLAINEQLQHNRDGSSTTTNLDPAQAFSSQLSAVLGEDRYIEYQRCKNPEYQTLVKIADRFSLPEEAARQILDLKDDIESQTRQVQTNANFDENQKAILLQALHDQATSALATTLGEKGWNVYSNYGGSWVDRVGN